MRNVFILIVLAMEIALITTFGCGKKKKSAPKEQNSPQRYISMDKKDQTSQVITPESAANNRSKGTNQENTISKTGTQFKPEDLKQLTGKNVAWFGSVMKVDTGNNKIKVLLFSETDANGKETVYVTQIPLPVSTGTVPKTGDKILVQGIMAEQFIVDNEGTFENYFDRRITRTTITVIIIPQTQIASSQEEIAPNETVEGIEVSIVLSVKPSNFPCPISDRLQSLIKKYDVETAFGVVAAGTTFVNMGNGVAIKLKKDWDIPFSFTADKIPVIKFKNGLIGVVDKEIYVDEETMALVGEKEYVYKNQKWFATSLIAPNKKSQ